MNILFICSGNVGRSQMAESIFNSLQQTRHTAASAGVDVVRGDDRSREGQLLGDNPDAAPVIRVMKEIGIDITSSVRKQVTPEMVSAADIVVCMVKSGLAPAYVQGSPLVVYWDVPDPFGQSEEFTRAVRDQLKVLVVQLRDTLD